LPSAPLGRFKVHFSSIFRHAYSETHVNHRVTCIERMEFDAAGLIKPIKLTHQGVPSRTLDKSNDDQAPRP
jgi:hypothetical protein